MIANNGGLPEIQYKFYRGRRMHKVFILSCGKSKLSHASPACEMYVGDLFKKSLAFARTQKPDAIYILSAKYGLLELDKVIEPYEMTLNSMPKAARMKWAEEVLSRLASFVDLQASEFIFLTGERYREHLVQHLQNVSTPLKGLSFGRQLSWLKSNK